MFQGQIQIVERAIDLEELQTGGGIVRPQFDRLFQRRRHLNVAKLLAGHARHAAVVRLSRPVLFLFAPERGVGQGQRHISLRIARARLDRLAGGADRQQRCARRAIIGAKQGVGQPVRSSLQRQGNGNRGDFGYRQGCRRRRGGRAAGNDCGRHVGKFLADQVRPVPASPDDLEIGHVGQRLVRLGRVRRRAAQVAPEEILRLGGCRCRLRSGRLGLGGRTKCGRVRVKTGQACLGCRRSFQWIIPGKDPGAPVHQRHQGPLRPVLQQLRPDVAGIPVRGRQDHVVNLLLAKDLRPVDRPRTAVPRPVLLDQGLANVHVFPGCVRREKLDPIVHVGLFTWEARLVSRAKPGQVIGDVRTEVEPLLLRLEQTLRTPGPNLLGSLAQGIVHADLPADTVQLPRVRGPAVQPAGPDSSEQEYRGQGSQHTAAQRPGFPRAFDTRDLAKRSHREVLEVERTDRAAQHSEEWHRPRLVGGQGSEPEPDQETPPAPGAGKEGEHEGQ